MGFLPFIRIYKIISDSESKVNFFGTENVPSTIERHMKIYRPTGSLFQY